MKGELIAASEYLFSLGVRSLTAHRSKKPLPIDDFSNSMIIVYTCLLYILFSRTVSMACKRSMSCPKTSNSSNPRSSISDPKVS